MYSYEYDSLRLWDVAEGTLIADLPNQHNPVISPDHSRLFTQDFNRDAFSFATVLWNLETNRELLRVTGNMPADFAADGATAVINGSRDNPTRLLQSSDAAILQTFADENFALVLPDGDTIVTRNWEGLKFRDAVNGRAQHTLEGYFHHLLPDGHTIITWDNGRIMVGDATDGQQIHTADLPLPGINYVWQEARSPAGLIPAAYLAFLQTVDSPQNAATFSGDGRFRLINNGREIEVWDEANYSGQGPYDVLYTIPAPGINNQLIVSPDSQMIAAVQNNNTISVWQAADGTPLLTLPPVPWIQDLQFSPDNQLLLATTSSDYTEALRVWELPSGNQILADSYGLEFHNNGSISYCYGQPLALAPDGGLAAYSDGHCQIQIVQTSDWQVLQTIDPGFGRNGRIAFSPDGQLLATAFQGGVINLWDTASGQLLHTIIDHDNPVDDEPTVQITFSDDGQLLGTSGNGILHLWGIWP
jgi:WD40 repeat protein